jgi:cob(I)alamin adenosyltransferase
LEQSNDKLSRKGYLHVYTGDGKGKTTAALGLALRAAGADLKVYIAQFLKKGQYSEIKALERFSDRITLEQFGRGRFVRGKPQAEDVEAAAEGLKAIKSIMAAGQHQMIVMDEANVAVSCGLFTINELLEIIDLKPHGVELVVTGRGAAPEILERADLVSEVKSLKHYFQNGVKARVGIEK